VAQNTLLSPPINPVLQQWVVSNSATINATAATLGVSPTSIALAVTEEASHIISAQPVLDEFGNAIPGAYTASENFKDLGQDTLISHFYSDSFITQNFFDRASDIVDGAKPGGTFAQLFNPTMMDVGWGNLNVGNSVLTLQNYLTQTGPGQTYEGDPLGLAKYGSDYSQFAADVANPASDVTFKIAGLNIAALNSSFANNYGSQYTNLPQNERDAYLVTGYKQGLSQIESNVPRNTINGIPTLPSPSAGDGGPFALANYGTVDNLLRSSSSTQSNSINQNTATTTPSDIVDQDFGAFQPSTSSFPTYVQTYDSSLGSQPASSVSDVAQSYLNPSANQDFGQPASTATDAAYSFDNSSYFSNSSFDYFNSSSYFNDSSYFGNDYNGSSGFGSYSDYGGGFGGGFDYGFAPVILDLTGQGINITQLSSSNTFFDATGSGVQNQMAWAGAGMGCCSMTRPGRDS
jgi:hypothetical protein